MKKALSQAIEAAYRGGREILKVYEGNFAVETKEDKSPLTLADKNAHHKIMEVLGDTLPILSEEGRTIEFAERSKWKQFWLVDPLDGTKEFVKRNGEFTVNIALIEDGKAVAGVIYVPVKDDLYFGAENKGAFKISNFDGSSFDWSTLESQAEPLHKKTRENRTYTAVGSRSHMSPETEAFFTELRNEHGEVNVVSMGSSLKICLVAEGVADIYPRFAPTMEWDTAAGHGIAKGAGKNIIDHKTGAEMCYNKENLLNNWFIVK
jgi:3'(2'), 5'-bisphosphate nucleotidase